MLLNFFLALGYNTLKILLSIFYILLLYISLFQEIRNSPKFCIVYLWKSLCQFELSLTYAFNDLCFFFLLNIKYQWDLLECYYTLLNNLRAIKRINIFRYYSLKMRCGESVYTAQSNVQMVRSLDFGKFTVVSVAAIIHIFSNT